MVPDEIKYKNDYKKPKTIEITKPSNSVISGKQVVKYS